MPHVCACGTDGDATQVTHKCGDELAHDVDDKVAVALVFRWILASGGVSSAAKDTSVWRMLL